MVDSSNSSAGYFNLPLGPSSSAIVGKGGATSTNFGAGGGTVCGGGGIDTGRLAVPRRRNPQTSNAARIKKVPTIPPTIPPIAPPDRPFELGDISVTLGDDEICSAPDAVML